ncbi:fasciclin domain-containing protein [Chitinophaga arvensicola]|uniref:Uncaracterized surface protein containing fasciclin (FAS1) repeats n=1 Tax=Chitinophaga arvensicola TaxID=29529 RepID=A0A1I0SBH1_9BACT|nr:fasciclin domain-containing protein [Chitinophaga arvensicola]SEW53915.1 Uncaracterized surface protein containing fasciclin (FAS1) repeats [Chitinophaga arvensicola]
MKIGRYAGVLLMLLAACTKKDDSAAGPDEINRLSYIIDDNKFNFSFFNTALGRTGYRNTLAGPGPYTVMIPDNNAFIKAGYANEQAVLTESGNVLNSLLSYHIVNGTWELNKLPFKFNQELTSVSGAKMYVTRWVKGTDTLLTINGTPLLAYNLPASNGVIQVLDNVLQPLTHKTLSAAISADTTLNFLNVALQQAGLKELLSGEDAYTVFAPSNQAFRQAGFLSIDSINATSPAVLREMLAYQLFSGRKFVYDYILTTGPSGQSDQAMSNGNNTTIQLLKSGVKYTGISITGPGNSTPAQVKKANVMAGNGVLHIIDQVLKENQ